MMDHESSVIIEQSEIHPEAKLLDDCTVLHSNVGEACVIGRFSKMAYSSIGLFSYIGEYTIVIDSTIGKFTSISWGVTIGPEEHDYKKLTNHSFLYSQKTFQLADKKYYSPFVLPCNIGNDVWIGCNATILRGVTVGHGAVIGANALVNKDVPPYAIVGGVPAKIIKYRFSEEIIEGLLKCAWWELPLDIIKQNAALFAEEPTVEIIEKILKLKQ